MFRVSFSTPDKVVLQRVMVYLPRQGDVHVLKKGQHFLVHRVVCRDDLSSSHGQEVIVMGSLIDPSEDLAASIEAFQQRDLLRWYVCMALELDVLIKAKKPIDRVASLIAASHTNPISAGLVEFGHQPAGRR